MTKYKAIVTTAGAEKIAAATAGGTQLKITQMAVGDGNGILPTPTAEQTQLVNEQYRAALNALDITNSSKNNIVAELIIPANVGGFWLREMGLFDESGELIAVGNMAESYKPKLEEGSGRTQTLRMVLIISSTEAIQVIASGDTVLATKDFVIDSITEHEKTRNHPNASTAVKGLVQLSNATSSTDETKAITPKALKLVGDASLKVAANLADIPNKSAARSNLALGAAATKNVGIENGQVMEVGAFGLGMGFNHRDDAYSNRSEIYRINSTSKNVPSNGVYGVLSLPCDGGPSSAYMAISNTGIGFLGNSSTSSIVKWSRIYSTNNKPTATDVGAWSQAEADGRYLNKAGDSMTGAFVLKSTITADYYGSTPDKYPTGSGAYASQLESKAPFYQPNFNWEVGVGGHYVPLVKGLSTRKGKGWPTAVSYGYLLPGGDMHAHPIIHAKGDGGVECTWEFDPRTGKINSKAGEFTPINETLNAIYPIGIVVLFANTTNPNTAFAGQRWEDLSAKGYDTRVLALGYNPLATGGSNNVTIRPHNLPDHSHKGGMDAPGKWYDTTVTGTDNSGNYKLGLTTHTFTDGTGNELVRNEPLDVRNEYVHMRGWMRVG